jgi:hypothetical protein
MVEVGQNHTFNVSDEENEPEMGIYQTRIEFLDTTCISTGIEKHVL